MIKRKLPSFQSFPPREIQLPGPLPSSNLHDWLLTCCLVAGASACLSVCASGVYSGHGDTVSGRVDLSSFLWAPEYFSARTDAASGSGHPTVLPGDTLVLAFLTEGARRPCAFLFLSASCSCPLLISSPSKLFIFLVAHFPKR